MLAGIEVLRFHGFLRVFDAPRNQAGFDGYAFGHSQAEHQRLDAFATKNAHQVVFQREEETRRSGVALSSGTATQLVVDAPGFVAFGAKNVQTAERYDFVVLGFTLLGELIVNRLPLIGGNLENFAFVLEQPHRRDWRRGAVAGSIDSGDYRGSRSIRHSHFIF